MRPHPRKFPFFDRFADRANRLAGGSPAFALAVATVLAWALLGPMFRFSENWQLTINTGTTIITFLMVFLVQHSQNKQTDALHLKLNELIASHLEASNRLISVEDLGEAELQTLHKFYQRLGKLAAQQGGLKETHSLDEASEKAERKKPGRRAKKV